MSGKNNFGGKQAPPFVKGGKKGKMRPGSISSGPGKGKFPITSPKSVKSASDLIGHAKGVSQKRVAKHILSAAKAKGYSVPAKVKKIADMSQPVEMVRVVGDSGDYGVTIDLASNWAKWDLARDRGKKLSPVEKKMRGHSSEKLQSLSSQAKGTMNNPGEIKKAAVNELIRRGKIRREFEQRGHLRARPTIVQSDFSVSQGKA